MEDDLCCTIFSFSSQGNTKVVLFGFSISSQGNTKVVLFGFSISSQGHMRVVLFGLFNFLQGRRAASLTHVPIQQAVAAGSESVRTKSRRLWPSGHDLDLLKPQ